MSERKPTILHVDDDEANRYAVTRSLVKAGFEVTEAADGREALRRVANKPDLVILDIRLPDIDGFEVCRRIKSDPATASIPILHLSASLITSEAKAQGLNGGAEGYLVRPVEPIELVATVNALLRAKRSEEALRQSEERYRLLVENIKDYAIFMVDPDGRVSSWNTGAEKILLYREDEVLGLPVALLFTPEDREAGVAEQEMGRSRDEGRSAATRWHVRKDGERFFVDGVMTAIRDGTGRLLGFSKLMQDVTDRKRAEEERSRLLKEAEDARAAAEAANRIKDEFLATLSHELRTPLNAIVGWSSILRSTHAADADLQDGLETIERNARVQTQLIEDLLDVSRIISGKLRLDVQRVELPPVVEAAIAAVLPAAEANGVRVQRRLESSETATLGDAGRLQQVAWNLLSNAVKFTPRGGEVRVTLARVGPMVELTVSDTGEGIAASFLPHVFERFRQADASTKRSHGGLGLGLAIVREVVELHHGTVDARSEGEGKGATFTVRLPGSVAPSSTVTASAEREQAVACVCAPGVLEGVRVLVVEDEADSRELVVRMLRDYGAQPSAAGSVSEAMECLRKHRFELLVSDIGMPGEDGFDLIRRVRALGPEQGGRMPAIALTAFAQVEGRRRMLLAGFQVHVPKPVNPGELIAVVARLVGRTGVRSGQSADLEPNKT